MKIWFTDMIVPGESLFPVAQYFTQIPYECQAGRVQQEYIAKNVAYNNTLVSIESKQRSLFLQAKAFKFLLLFFVVNFSNSDTRLDDFSSTPKYQTKLMHYKKVRKTSDDPNDPCHQAYVNLLHLYSKQKMMIAFSCVPSIVLLLTQIDKISKKFYISKSKKW